MIVSASVYYHRNVNISVDFNLWDRLGVYKSLELKRLKHDDILFSVYCCWCITILMSIVITRALILKWFQHDRDKFVSAYLFKFC